MTIAQFLFNPITAIIAFFAVATAGSIVVKCDGKKFLLLVAWIFSSAYFFHSITEALTDDYESEYSQVYIWGETDLSSCGDVAYHINFGQTLEEKVADVYAEAAAEASNEIHDECRSKLWNEWRDVASRHPQRNLKDHKVRVFAWQNNPFTEVK